MGSSPALAAKSAYGLSWAKGALSELRFRLSRSKAFAEGVKPQIVGLEVGRLSRPAVRSAVLARPYPTQAASRLFEHSPSFRKTRAWFPRYRGLLLDHTCDPTVRIGVETGLDLDILTPVGGPLLPGSLHDQG